MKRVFHPWWDWECYRGGMYSAVEMEYRKAIGEYANFLADTVRFRNALDRVLKEWPVSCEQFLSNESINRIAWLGQASMCIDTRIPARYRAGFKLLTNNEQAIANATALCCLNKWLVSRGESFVGTGSLDDDGEEDQSIRGEVEAHGVPGGHTGRSAQRIDESGARAFIQSDMFGYSQSRPRA